jgi:ubiquinone/menaquinone biosynthesis C-methylase UbiE
MPKRAAGGFADVDSSRNPPGYGAYLSAVTGMAAIAAGKRRRDEMLAVGSGDTVLEVGCGLGDDVRAVAALVGAQGRVVGLDASATLIAEARRRTSIADGPVEFVVGDAHALPFGDASFDAARVERSLQHMDAPDVAVIELARVVRAGGAVVACEPDFGSITVDVPDRASAREALDAVCDRAIRNGWIGRELRRHFLDAGLEAVVVDAETIVFDDIEQFRQLADFAGLARSLPQTRPLFDAFTRRAAAGRFLATVTLFTARGQAPPAPRRS